MNSDLRHKIYEYEVTPPPAVWEKVVAELDESYLAEKFPAILRGSTVVPPATAWSSISAALDELHIGTHFPSTLYNMEAAPPAGAWQKIAATLEDQPNQRAAAPIRRISPIFRYAAAAVILGAIAFGTLRILSKSSSGDGPSAIIQPPSNTIPPATGNSTPNADASNKNDLKTAPITSDEARNDQALEESKQTYAALSRSEKQRMKRVNEDFFREAADPIIVSANFNPVHTYEELECADVNMPLFAGGVSPSIEMAGRYTMLLSPDGHFVRVSKKLGELVCCVTGEEQDEECVDQLKKWRKKIANSPVAPAPGNFMDIMDLLQTLKDSNL